MKTRKSAEDYLEMMLMLENNKGYIKSVDIAKNMSVTKPSVSYAVKKLREEGHITMEGDMTIHLTESGRSIATSVYERHTALTAVFMAMGVSEETACEDACKIEHEISEESFNAIISYAKEKLNFDKIKHSAYHIKV